MKASKSEEISFAEIIQSGFVKQEDVRKFAGKIFDETQRLVTLVDDII